MPRSSRKSEWSRERLVHAAGEAFRRKGLGGIGVDGLASGAKMTSGAFYFHFGSKMEVFGEAVRVGLRDLRAGIEQTQAEAGGSWLRRFTGFYLGERRTCEPGQGCALPAFTSEIERAGPETQAIYRDELMRVAEAMARGLGELEEGGRRERAWVILALLSGGVGLARAVGDPGLSAEIGQAVEQAVLALGAPHATLSPSSA